MKDDLMNMNPNLLFPNFKLLCALSFNFKVLTRSFLYSKLSQKSNLKYLFIIIKLPFVKFMRSKTSKLKYKLILCSPESNFR